MKMAGSLIQDKVLRYKFLFEELVKRDFKTKYKRTFLGMGWSMLMPLLHLLVMKVVFEQFFGRGVEHYTTYVFAGNIVFAWFSEATRGGMTSLVQNAHIFSKVTVPKYLFLFAKGVQTFLNFALTLIIFFAFCALDHIHFTWKFVFLIYPVVTMLVLVLGLGLILSALFVFFRDMDYLWSVFLQLLMYGSAIFYYTDDFSGKVKLIFACNPVYRHIDYFREIVINGVIPSAQTHLLLAAFAVVAFAVGSLMYKHYNTKFLYYV